MHIPPWTLVVGGASLIALLSQAAPMYLDQALKLVDGTVTAAAHRSVAAIVAGPAAGLSLANGGSPGASGALTPDLLALVDAVSAPLPVTVATVMLCAVLGGGVRVGGFVLGLGTLMGLCAIGERDADRVRQLVGGWITLSAIAASPWLVRATATAVLAELLMAGEALRVASCVDAGCLERFLAGDFGMRDPILMVAAFTAVALTAAIPLQACRFAYAQLRLDWLRWRKSGAIEPDAPLLSVEFKLGQHGHGGGKGGEHVYGS